MNEVSLLKTQYQEMIDKYQYLDSRLSNIEAHNNITPPPFKKSAPLSAAAKSYQPAANKPPAVKDIEKVVGQQTIAINKQLYQQQQSTSSSDTVSRQEVEVFGGRLAGLESNLANIANILSNLSNLQGDFASPAQ